METKEDLLDFTIEIERESIDLRAFEKIFFSF
jgi:hypothetical protein